MEIAQHTARGAMDVVDETPVVVDQLIEQVVEAVPEGNLPLASSEPYNH